MTRQATRRGGRGQAAVETAIVMPLFVFIILGLLQLGLMHQAKLMAKYAAFKAVRAGSINRGDKAAMTNAAISVLLPMISRDDEVGGVRNTGSASKFTKAFNEVAKSANNKQGNNTPIVDVTICHPRRNDADEKTDFDDPRNNTVTGARAPWRPFEKTKLAIQVTFYYRMFIPFANAFVWYAAYGQETAAQMDAMKYALRTKTKKKEASAARTDRDGGGWTLARLKSEADGGKYIMPIRASYAMRMMSNFKNGVLPNKNDCRVAWQKQGN
ncbi:MAG: pilus assembly protein [Myxococcales bacterium]|nr:pilus assembly protein [Myxococcales bacterium]